MAAPRAPPGWRETIHRARPLVRRGDPAALDLLLPALRWPHDPARAEAVRLLVALGDPAVPRLLAIVARPGNGAEHRAATEAFGRIARAVVVPALLRALGSPDRRIVRTAARSLLDLDAREAVPALARLLLVGPGDLRPFAAAILGAFRDPAAVSALRGALLDEDERVRAAAATALGRIRDSCTVAALTRAARDPCPEVSGAARRALARTLGSS